MVKEGETLPYVRGDEKNIDVFGQKMGGVDEVSSFTTQMEKLHFVM